MADALLGYVTELLKRCTKFGKDFTMEALAVTAATYLQEIEELLKSHVLVRSDLSLQREHFDIN